MNDQRLRALTSRLDHWLSEAAFPLWWERGADHAKGGFHELLGLDGVPPPEPFRRARVQSRQSYSYALAGALGWTGPWRQAAPHGIDFLIRHYLGKDGEFCTLVSAEGATLDTATLLYDQAFALLAMAHVVQVLPERTDLANIAHRLIDHIERTRRHPPGGFAESSGQRFQANAHMHLLEAMLAWSEVEPGTIWDRLADEIAALCLGKFIDPDGGFLREFFDEEWRPSSRIVEPGHQFEWAWLIERWSRARRDARAHQAAWRLFEAGLRGVDGARDVAIDELSDDFAVTRTRARLWPQTERVKAALILAETATGAARTRCLSEAERATVSLCRYLETPLPGLWRDKLQTDDTFVEEPAPASSFYHIVCCIASLRNNFAPG